MTSWTDTTDTTDAYDSYDSESYEGESAYDGEGESDGESARSERARLARARRIALARGRMGRRAPVWTQRVPTRPTEPAQTVAAIRRLDLESKVGEDSLRAALERANRRAARATYATVTSTAVDQILDSFGADLAPHDFVRAGLRSAPLLLLSPERKRQGLEGFLLDPRFLGLAGVAAVVAAGKFHDRGSGVSSIKLSPTTVNGNGRFTAFARDKQGRLLTDTEVTFKSSDSLTLQVDPNGDYRPQQAGDVFVIVTAGGFTDLIEVQVQVDVE